MSEETHPPVLTVRVGRYEVTAPYERIPLELRTGAKWGLTSHELGRLEFQAAIAVLGRVPSIGGSELKCARKIMGLTHAELAARLDLGLETVRGWEDSETLETTTQLAVLRLLEQAARIESPSAGPVDPLLVLRLVP